MFELVTRTLSSAATSAAVLVKAVSALSRIHTFIEGCFPNMNKSDIQQGLTGITTLLTQTYGYDAVYIPPTRTKQCSWKERRGYKKIAFCTLLDIMNFALDNTLIKNRDDYIQTNKRHPNGRPKLSRHDNWSLCLDGTDIATIPMPRR